MLIPWQFGCKCCTSSPLISCRAEGWSSVLSFYKRDGSSQQTPLAARCDTCGQNSGCSCWSCPKPVDLNVRHVFFSVVCCAGCDSKCWMFSSCDSCYVLICVYMCVYVYMCIYKVRPEYIALPSQALLFSSEHCKKSALGLLPAL